MEDLTFLTSLQVALQALAWICAAGAFFDLVVLRTLRRIYIDSIEQASNQGRLLTAAQLAVMLPLFERLERIVGFITCWGLLRQLAEQLRQALARRSDA